MYVLLVLQQHALLDEALPAELAAVPPIAKVLVFRLLVLVQVVLLGRAVVTLIAPVRLLPSVTVDVPLQS